MKDEISKTKCDMLFWTLSFKVCCKMEDVCSTITNEGWTCVKYYDICVKCDCICLKDNRFLFYKHVSFILSCYFWHIEQKKLYIFSYIDF